MSIMEDHGDDHACEDDDDDDDDAELDVCDDMGGSRDKGCSPLPGEISPEQQTLNTLQRINSDHCYCHETALWLEPPTSRTPFPISRLKKESTKSKYRHADYKCPVRRGLGTAARKSGKSTGRRRMKDVMMSRRYFSHHSREKREMLNQMERDRRIGLKTCFERLRVVVPETSGNTKASKDKILLYARTKIRLLECANREGDEELVRLRRENEGLRLRLKRVSRELAN